MQEKEGDDVLNVALQQNLHCEWFEELPFAITINQAEGRQARFTYQ